MIRAGRGERGVPLGDGRKKRAVGESKIKDRGSCTVRKGKTCVQPLLVEEGVATLRRVVVVRMRQTKFPRIKFAQRIGSRVVYVEVTHHQGRERVTLK